MIPAGKNHIQLGIGLMGAGYVLAFIIQVVTLVVNQLTG